MGGRSALLCLGLLALSFVLLPRRGEGAAGIDLLGQAVDGTEMEVLHGEAAQDEPGEEDELKKTQAGKVKRATEEEDLPARFRRVPEEEGKETKKKDKKERKEKKNRDPKEPKATKKPKAEKKQKEKGGRRGKEKDQRLEAPTTTTTQAPTTTTPPPTTTELYTEPAPTEADPYPDYPDSDDDYWNLEEEQPTIAEPEDDYWTPEEEQPTIAEPEDDYWTPEEEQPAGPVVDLEDDYWKSEEPTTPRPSPTVYKEVDIEDDYYEGKYDEYVPLPDGAEVIPTEKDDWSYDVTDEPENVPQPDAKEEIIPTEKDDWSYVVTEEPVTLPPTYESPWYEEYDYGHSGGQSKQEEERERQRKEKEKEERGMVGHILFP
ncbi:hypothetical protein UPYG_G00259010 [Umbra pygmaea]|uniref:Uncharacterized protein n=1 Tax=Umbra pygmaea TaxID=75934 RepID=A0ABD0WSW3_UMBPY